MRPTHDHEQSDAALLPEQPRVSVLVITYNQQDYVTEALSSAASQLAAFPFEMVIGEDCSADATRSVCAAFQRAHPDKARLLWSDRNFGFQHNFVRTLSACRGEYVALLEGDDAWTDPAKLERQVAALDAHPSINVCITQSRKLLPDGTQASAPEWDRGASPRLIPTAELTAKDGMMAPTASILARREALLGLPEWVAEAPVFDSFLLLGLAGRKGAWYLPEETSLYRVSSAGSWSESFENKPRADRVAYSRRMLAAYDSAVRDFGIPAASLRRRLSTFHLLLARDAFRHGALGQALRHCLRLDPRYVGERVRHRLGRV
ncbi:glycosyltransferase family 2 protein [Sphingomonas alba]|uniref:Glycosyltransferase n=1 Tax=Sphingomonas alba TaxID=2908208 RepID=A0ABT0RJA4_9SPHN|nr:glycosyltransferase [Sphingomonas alba]